MRNLKCFISKMVKSSDCMLSAIVVCLSITVVISESTYVQLNEPEIYHSQTLQPELVRIFENCHINSSTFDPCMKTAFNELRAYFPTGMFKIAFLQHYYLIFTSCNRKWRNDYLLCLSQKDEIESKNFGAYWSLITRDKKKKMFSYWL